MFHYLGVPICGGKHSMNHSMNVSIQYSFSQLLNLLYIQVILIIWLPLQLNYYLCRNKFNHINTRVTL
jgi:hypothetical protein